MGLPNVGKSTLFNALTRAGAEVANYPFCTIDPNVGVVEVPDQRLEVLAGILKPQRTVPAIIEFVDIAGLVKGAHHGEGLGNQFLDHIRNVDALVHVIRCFEEPQVIRAGSVDALTDLEVLETELILADLEIAERRLKRNEREIKSGDKRSARERKILQKLCRSLDNGNKARKILTAEEKELLADVPLLTGKPEMIVANIQEKDLPEGSGNNQVKELSKRACEEDIKLVVLCAQFEMELSEMGEEKKDFLQEYQLREPGLEKLVREGFQLLDLVTFFTIDGPEVRAWTVKAGTKAPVAAGKIHSDMERGFIRAEVVSYKELVEHSGISSAKAKGLVRLEGKEYCIREGDVIHFRFNV